MRKREDIESDYVDDKVSKRDLTFEVMLDIRSILLDFFLEYLDDKYEPEFCDDPMCPDCMERKRELGLVDDNDEEVVIEELTEDGINKLCAENGICLEGEENEQSSN